MKKILLAVLIVGVVAAIAVSGTMAYFSASATATSTVTAATAQLEFSGGSTTAVIPLSNTTALVPGGTTSGDVHLWNTGNAALYVQTKVASNNSLYGHLTWSYALGQYSTGVAWQDGGTILYIPAGGDVVLTITGTYADTGKDQSGEMGASVTATATFTGHSIDEDW